MNGKVNIFSWLTLGSSYYFVLEGGGGTSLPIYTLLAKTDPTCVLPENYAILQRKPSTPFLPN